MLNIVLNTSRSPFPKSPRRTAQSGQTMNSPDQDPIGFILDLAPPFAFLEADEFASFSELVRKHDARRIALTLDDRETLFVPANDRVRDYYIAPKEALLSANGALMPAAVGWWAAAHGEVEAETEEFAIRAKLIIIEILIGNLHTMVKAEFEAKLNAVPWP